MAPALATYAPRDPSHTVLYTVIADHLETFLASCEADPDATGLPAYVKREFYDYLHCGILAHGFLRLGCDTCPKELLLPFSCKRRGFCPSCAARRMAQTAAHLVTCVIPWVPTRQWVVSVPLPLRYWMAASQDLTAQVHTIIRTTIGQYFVNQAVTRGLPRANVQPGSVTFIQRFGSALNLHLHFHCVFLEGGWIGRTKALFAPLPWPPAAAARSKASRGCAAAWTCSSGARRGVAQGFLGAKASGRPVEENWGGRLHTGSQGAQRCKPPPQCARR